MSHDEVESGFNLQEGGGHPALVLIAILPAAHSTRVEFQTFIHILDTVGRLEASTELLKHTEPMKHQGLLHALFKTGDCRSINFFKLRFESI